MLVPAVMVVMSLVYALAAYLRGRAVRQRLRAQGYAAPLWTHGTAAIDRESWPRSAVGGGGYIGPGPCSFGEQAQPMIYLRVKIEEAAEQNLDQDPATSVVLGCRLPGVV